ncbi:MAG: hypothetical protein WBA46_01765 [Thermomicrobiales bacterium]
MAKKLDPHEAFKRQFMLPAERRKAERYDKVPDFIWKIFGWMLIALVLVILYLKGISGSSDGARCTEYETGAAGQAICIEYDR